MDSKAELEPSISVREEDEKYPEGGSRAWLVVFGAWCAMIPCMGLVNTINVLHAWTATYQLTSTSESNIGWVFGAFAFFLYFGSAQVGPIFDRHGVLPLVVPGSIGIVLAIFFFSESTEYYQIFLSFSVLGGLSSCCLLTPAISAVGHWFNVRRGLATGIACTAGGVGGAVFPLIIIYVAPKLGFTWAMRIIGIISFFSCCLACLLMKTRLPPNKKAGIAMDLKVLLDARYALAVLAISLVELAVFVPYAYISSYSLHYGGSQSMAYWLSIFLNLGAIPGRAVPGLLADKFGRFNLMIPVSLLCSILTLAMWYTAHGNQAVAIAYIVLLGLCSGSIISLTPVCVSQLCSIEDYGKRSGTAYTVISIAALVSIPIGGAILERNHGEYEPLILFAGVVYIGAFVAFVLARGVSVGWKLRTKF